MVALTVTRSTGHRRWAPPRRRRADVGRTSGTSVAVGLAVRVAVAVAEGVAVGGMVLLGEGDGVGVDEWQSA